MAELFDPRGLYAVVTGGAGFVGSELAAQLSDQNSVVAFDDLSRGDRERVPDDITFNRGDVRDRSAVSELLAGADVVFHQAGLASVERSVDDPLASHTRNATGTLNVLEAAKEHDVRVVLASSAAIYGPPEYVPVDESHPTAPTAPYGLDKLTADRYARLYYRLYGVETVTLRYFNVYGPGQTAGVVGAFVERARDGRPLTIYGDGEQTRDFVHVNDVVRANCLAATAPDEALGRAFNVGTGTATTIESLAEVMRERFDSDSEIRYEPPRDGDIRESVADVSLAESVLGFEPSVPLKRGLEDFQ